MEVHALEQEHAVIENEVASVAVDTDDGVTESVEATDD